MNEKETQEDTKHLNVYTHYGYAKVEIDILKKIEENNKKINENIINEQQKEKDKEIRERETQNITRNEEVMSSSRVLEEKIDIIPVKYSWGDGFLNKNQLRSHINIFVKTFYGPRRKYEFNVNITDKIGIIYDKISQDAKETEDIYNFHGKRIISPSGTIQQLDPESTFEAAKINNDSLLLLIVQKTFHWDPNYKGSNIILLNDNLTANKKNEMDTETVFGTIGFENGRHYWEIKLDALVEIQDIIVGVAQKEMNLYTRPLDTDKFWGYVCLCQKKLGPGQPAPIFVDYGTMCQIGDTIGILIEFKNDEVSLTFYRNGENLGKAFSNMPSGVYYPAACLYYGEVQVTLNSSAPIPKN